jgi:hypothetical protein
VTKFSLVSNIVTEVKIVGHGLGFRVNDLKQT